MNINFDMLDDMLDHMKLFNLFNVLNYVIINVLVDIQGIMVKCIILKIFKLKIT
jgi:hypothetical protein